MAKALKAKNIEERNKLSFWEKAKLVIVIACVHNLYYDNFLKESVLAPVEEEFGANSKLLWIGPKRNDRVILYLHGGAFLLAMPSAAPAFWRYIQESLEKRGKPTGVAILEYTFIPDALFPAQLEQVVVAIQHHLNSGVKPENIQLLNLSDNDGCLSTNDGNGDFLNGRTLNYWGTKCLEGVPLAVIPYIEPNSAQADWFEGCDKHIKCILITTGGVEAL
ncbi:hypothetical protein CPB84DRAFT_1747458 [Gymnopilus junonius]|uniref:Alpha/beta hydrolase fold-3 domain-containing protein n=1 Tax=Gymnopilus junonius TaxID=109634 RepID=A0A9P5NMR9_GYMJU|nr:hypothetical protein CPB84DRAFT_1747458 [Gymnopilus junonius]